LGEFSHINQNLVRRHLGEVVRSTVEETLTAMLGADADRLRRTQRYEHSPDRVDTRAGHYERQLHTKAGEVALRGPKLRSLPFETAIIGWYRRRETSVEEALLERYYAGVSPRRVGDITEALCGTRVVGAFPDGNSALLLVSARLRHIAGKTWGAKRYLDMTHLKNLQPESAVSQDQTA